MQELLHIQILGILTSKPDKPGIACGRLVERLLRHLDYSDDVTPRINQCKTLFRTSEEKQVRWLGENGQKIISNQIMRSKGHDVAYRPIISSRDLSRRRDPLKDNE